jgi:Flp pilus assembly protein CpaB
MAVAAPEASPVERADAPRRSGRTGRGPRLAERLTLNLVVGVVAALLAFVLAASLLTDRREMTIIMVATDQIGPGTAITPSMVTSEELPASTRFVDQLVTLEQVESGEVMATRTIGPGEPLLASATGEPGAAAPRRVMSIPLESWQAAGGDIEVGDQVDVIATTRDGGARYVLQAASVVDRSSADDAGGLVGGSRSGDLVITVEVDADQALDLAAAIESGTLTVVRSTGVPASSDVATGTDG